MNEHETIARDEAQKANEQLKQGCYDDALSAFSAAAEAYEKCGNLRKQASQLQVMAELYQLLKRLEDAEAVYTRLMELYDRLKDDAAGAAVLGNLGLLKAFSGDLEKALGYLRRAESRLASQGDELRLAQLWGNIGSVHRDMKVPGRALEHYHKALTVFERMNRTEPVADQCANIAYIHATQAQSKEAVAWFKRALDLYRKAGNEEKARLTEQNLQRLSD